MWGALFIIYKAIVFIAVFLFAYYIYIRKKSSHMKGYLLLTCVFLLYISLVFDITGSGTVYDISMRGLFINPNQLNLKPFSHHIDLIGYIENVIMFMPLGFLIPFFINKKHILAEVCIIFSYGLIFSVLIELSQLLNIRATDVDDLIMNTLGATLGYFSYLIFNFIFRQGERLRFIKDNILIPAMYIAILFLGRFFLYNEYGLAKLVYRF